jgi:hypothetical protein
MPTAKPKGAHVNKLEVTMKTHNAVVRRVGKLEEAMRELLPLVKWLKSQAGQQARER